MLPLWLRYYVKRSERYFHTSSHLPLSALLLLLREIGQFQGRDFLLVEPPRSAVFHPGEGMYLFYPNSHRQLASFDLRNFAYVHSVGLRYRDPLNIKSGVDTRVLTGWIGVVRLIESAVNSSPYFDRLQTIETSCRTMRQSEGTYSDADETHVSTYDIWVETRRNWVIGWQFEEPFWEANGHAADPRRWGEGGALVHNFCSRQPVLLARVEVERPVSYECPDLAIEIVRRIELYPEYDSYWYDLSEFEEEYGRPRYTEFAGTPRPRRHTAQYAGSRYPLDYLRIDGKVMNLPPHSELQMSYRR